MQPSTEEDLVYLLIIRQELSGLIFSTAVQRGKYLICVFFLSLKNNEMSDYVIISVDFLLQVLKSMTIIDCV